MGLLRVAILWGAKGFLWLLGYQTYIVHTFYLKMLMGRSVHVVYSCLGYGIISFWLAFVFANTGSFKKKALWMVCGVLVIWSINVIRIALLLLAINNKWNLFLGLDHHSLFNITTYLFIFIGIYFYDRSNNKTAVSIA